MVGFQETPQIGRSKDNKRLHLRHGPIELVIEAQAPTIAERETAYRAACDRFETVLPDLCGELSLLRTPISKQSAVPETSIGRAMHEAASPFADKTFVTPMIAVAGSVADYILRTMREASNLSKIFVNNGGDIALHLERKEISVLGICSNVETATINQRVTLCGEDKIGGVATSGWKGRSHSLGIADAVTVFAENAARADCAATLIANAVNIPASPKIRRSPAKNLAPDSDLGDHLVTVGVDPLSALERREALAQGSALAQSFVDQGLIASSYLSLQGETCVIFDEAVQPRKQPLAALC